MATMGDFLRGGAKFGAAAAPFAGAALGSFFPGIGTAIGGAAGGGLGALLSQLSTVGLDNPNKALESQFGQSQAELLQQLRQQQPFQPLSFAPIEQEYIRQFNQQTIPGIAERFTGNQRSSAFQNALGGAGSDLASRLAGLRGQFDVGQQQAAMQNRGQNLSQMGQLQNMLQAQQMFGLKRGEQSQYAQQQLLNSLLSGLQGYGNLQQGQMQQAANLAGQGLGMGSGQQFDLSYRPGQKGFLQGAAEAFDKAGDRAAQVLSAMV